MSQGLRTCDILIFVKCNLASTRAHDTLRLPASYESRNVVRAGNSAGLSRHVQGCGWAQPPCLGMRLGSDAMSRIAAGLGSAAMSGNGVRLSCHVQDRGYRDADSEWDAPVPRAQIPHALVPHAPV